MDNKRFISFLLAVFMIFTSCNFVLADDVGESEIVKMVAINKRGNILPPCGRCREFISQLNDANIEAEVLINRQRAVKLIDLLPYDWRQSKMSEVE